MDKKLKYQWQGEPITIEHGQVLVKKNELRPFLWSNYECSLSENGEATIEVIRINYEGELFLLSNQFGIGIHKVENGGWPNLPHFSFFGERFDPIDDFQATMIFDKKGYLDHEEKRDQWRKETHPEEWEKIRSLREMINKKK